VATRLGSPAINLLPRAHFPDLALPGDAVTLGVRPEHVAVRRAVGGAPQGRIRRVEALGDQSHLHIDLGGAALVTLVDPEAGLAEGDTVSVTLLEPLVFDAAGRRVRTQGAQGR
jgi:multiple sugar transport system ATP-binding protein